MPMELMTGKSVHEAVLLLAAIVGAATVGVSGVGRCKVVLLDVLRSGVSLP
jgi:hypothetical protein